MKKAIVLILMTLTCLTVFAGCGSGSKEERQARKEIEELKNHLEDEAAEDGIDLKNLFTKEAAEDGVDLQALFEQEAAESIARTEARTRDRETKQAVREELNAYYDPLLQAEYDALIAAATAEETRMHGDRYNELISERNALGEEADVYWSGRSSHIMLDNSYRSKALFLAASPFSDYDEYHLYYTGDYPTDTQIQKMMLLYVNNNSCNNWRDLVFIKEDDSVCELNLNDLYAEETFTELTLVSDSVVEICAIENADWNFYLFDISGPEGTLIARSTDYEDSEYYEIRDSLITSENKMGETYEYAPAWDDTLEELNDMIVRNTFGMAGDPYKYS